MTVAPHLLIISVLLLQQGFRYCQLGVGYCFIHSFGNARNQENRVRQYVPTPIFLFNADHGDREAKRDLINENL